MFKSIIRPLTLPFQLLVHGALKLLLKLLVKPHFTAPDIASNPALPVFYVMDQYSLTETLLLSKLMQKAGLPGIQSLPLGSENFSINLLCLQRAPGLGKAFLGPQTTGDLERFWQVLQAQPTSDVLVIPVSFFWGRAPGREEPLLKLLTAQRWGLMGGLHRLLAILLHGRQLWVETGQPIQVRKLMDQQTLMARGANHAAEKSRRLLQLYFRRVRTRVLGPDLSHRRTLVNSLMASPALREAIRQATAEGKIHKPREQALKYINEIASSVSYPVLLILDRLLSRLWTRLYDGVRVTGLDAIKTRAGHYTLVYLPCHRSHIDYLLLSYVLFRHGLMPPHIAAGINLNMPVIGPLLRRGGAFFMRRSFRDNPLYAAVFNEYFCHLLAQGHPVEYFVEGGRSRTGRTLPPRPGMLSMTLKAAQRGTRKPLLLVPVYLGYEKVLEGNTYLSELRGKSKKKESPLDLLRVLNSLRQYFGRVDVSFGEPLALDNLSTTNQATHQDAVNQLSHMVACSINQAATLNRVNLVALALLASPHRAMEANNLLAQMQTLQQLASMQGVHKLPEDQPQDWLDATERLGFIERMEHPLGDLYRCQEQQGILLTWYRNNSLHLFALPALVAFLFTHQKNLTTETLQQQAGMVYPLLAEELFLPWPVDKLNAQLNQTLEQLQQIGLLELGTSGEWLRPAEHLPGCMRLRLLGSLVQPMLERYYLLLALLERHGSGHLDHKQLVALTQQMAQRLAVLQGLNSPEYSDSRLFEQALQQLMAQGWVQEDEQQQLIFTDQLLEITRRGRQVFDPQLRHSLLSLTLHHSL
ncbi:glycerol-3-phosphate 1-O-acyltransferase PlsB [Marinospirillum alkaliphilum]|uniref:Glycerol-3-phosphate acyltransferase n=1 Tax=Marinospirillum alkaliphilum DSM 21637 TaxID=1122209 RepID=A0A1K1VEG5_9GAMM|nr:glycerol-3-phosphate 1-O-acyltransferase PlsB [Marinospirillum alkaliphilum]SFX23530.1 glycerol-3-phosphate acyltransferase [Marinospirillum alkaliphilum DSM 21637]